MELPHSPDELERMLEAKLDQWHRAAEAAERTRNSRRLEVMRDYRERFVQQSARLAQLGLAAEAREAQALAARLEAEQAALSARLAPVAGATANVTPANDAPQAIAPSPDAAVQPIARRELITAPDAPAPLEHAAVDSAGLAAVAPAPSVDAAQSAPAPSAADREEAARLVDKLHEQFRMLNAGAPEMDLEELKLRIEVLAAEGHLLQQRFPFLCNDLLQAGDRMRLTFGGLTRICYDLLNPRGIRVAALKRDMRANWAKYITDHRDRLEELVQRRAATARRRAEEEENRRRRAQVEAENQRRHDVIKSEILDHLTAPANEQDSYWSEDLRDLVEDYHRLSPKSTDGEIVRALEPHAALFEGKQFRWLRKKLNPKAAETVALDSAIDEALVSQNPSLSKTRAFEQWRAFYKSRSAVLIGGSERDTARGRLKDFFQFATLDWIENERTEAADTRAVHQRIVNRRYDLVFYLARFSSHALQACAKDACRESGVPFVLVERGYGIGACCRALERMGDMVRDLGESQ